ncbi:hypothetical protein BS50DRAFT_270133 [Corynespora cassiicola Philippines]|uniref:Uncharacterized protein n=1 Tax=Corynespora cassiicola Philippines TaxID=1448308 RepID=A0A2T2NZV6_CORCC|nr:hypothetical protein BS50DRAFT_270133 [Corynespora cassiicola Philippines]
MIVGRNPGMDGIAAPAQTGRSSIRTAQGAARSDGILQRKMCHYDILLGPKKQSSATNLPTSLNFARGYLTAGLLTGASPTASPCKYERSKSNRHPTNTCQMRPACPEYCSARLGSALGDHAYILACFVKRVCVFFLAKCAPDQRGAVVHAHQTVASTGGS